MKTKRQIIEASDAGQSALRNRDISDTEIYATYKRLRETDNITFADRADFVFNFHEFCKENRVVTY